MTQTRGNLQQANVDKQTPVTKDKGTIRLSRFRQIGLASIRFFTSHTWLPCILIGGIALGFNLFRLGAQSMWFDEVLSVERARQSLPVLLQIIFNTQPNMALYYVFLHFWLSLTSALGFNPTEVVVRLPSAIFAAFSAIMVFLLGRRFLGFVAGLLGAGLYLLNDLQLIYAQETRSYALQLWLICITWYALLAIFTGTSHQKRWWACYAIVTVLAIYTHLFSGLILAAQIIA